MASRPGLFIPRERALDTHWLGGLMGPRSGLDSVARRKKIPLFPLARIEPRSSSPYRGHNAFCLRKLEY